MNTSHDHVDDLVGGAALVGLMYVLVGIIGLVLKGMTLGFAPWSWLTALRFFVAGTGQVGVSWAIFQAEERHLITPYHKLPMLLAPIGFLHVLIAGWRQKWIVRSLWMCTIAGDGFLLWEIGSFLVWIISGRAFEETSPHEDYQQAGGPNDRVKRPNHGVSG